MSAFETWREHVIKWEGGISDHKNDRGGYTNKGVTIGTWQNLAPKLFNIPGTAETLTKMSDAQHRVILAHFWGAVNGNKINSQPVAAALAEWAWGSGTESAGKAVQRILNTYFGKSLKVDGAIGPNTLKAINSVNGQQLFDYIAQARIQFYKQLVKQKPDQKVFEEGWLARANDFIAQRNVFFLEV